MNKELSEILRIYSTDTHERFSQRLINSSKETLIALLTDLLTMYLNDRNSSTLREYLTVTIAGYEHSEKKIGFNGFKQNSIVGGKPLACEAKPKNFNTEDLLLYQQGKRRKPALLNGNGNFTDYTYNRFAKDYKENPHILVSGFVDGKLLYVLEFPFRSKAFVKRLRVQLKKRFPYKKRGAGAFLRSATFTYHDFISPDVRIVFLRSTAELDTHRTHVNKSFFQYLHEKAA